MNATVRVPNRLTTTALVMLCLCPLACGGQVVEFPLVDDAATDSAPGDISAVPIEVHGFAVTESSVPAPDYGLTVDGLSLWVDANDVVQSAMGAAVLTAGQVTGQRYVVAAAAGLALYSEIDDAYLAGADHALTTDIPAADFTLVGADLTTPEARSLILANIVSDVRAYQVFEIVFHPPH